jgi:hypothetical protein
MPTTATGNPNKRWIRTTYDRQYCKRQVEFCVGHRASWLWRNANNTVVKLIQLWQCAPAVTLASRLMFGVRLPSKQRVSAHATVSRSPAFSSYPPGHRLQLEHTRKTDHANSSLTINPRGPCLRDPVWWCRPGPMSYARRGSNSPNRLRAVAKKLTSPFWRCDGDPL